MKKITSYLSIIAILFSSYTSHAGIMLDPNLSVTGTFDETIADPMETLLGQTLGFEGGTQTQEANRSGVALVGDPLPMNLNLQETDDGFEHHATVINGGLGPAEYASRFDFLMDNQTIDDYRLTWTLDFDLIADAVSDAMEIYLLLSDASTFFERDIWSDLIFGDLIIEDGVESFPPGSGDEVRVQGTHSFSFDITAGTNKSFGGSLGFQGFGLNDKGIMSMGIKLTGIENLTNSTPPPPPPPTGVPEPASWVLMVTLLGLLNCRRKLF